MFSPVSKEVSIISTTVGKVVGLHICVAHRKPMQSVSNINMIEGAGIEGDLHAKLDGSRKRRQVLIMDRETLTEFELADGVIKENITIEGLRMDLLQDNQSILIGEAELTISEDCAPCSRMDEIKPGLQNALLGRRGKLAQVVKSGPVELGDQITILTS